MPLHRLIVSRASVLALVKRRRRLWKPQLRRKSRRSRRPNARRRQSVKLNRDGPQKPKRNVVARKMNVADRRRRNVAKMMNVAQNRSKELLSNSGEKRRSDKHKGMLRMPNEPNNNAKRIYALCRMTLPRLCNRRRQMDLMVTLVLIWLMPDLYHG
jgi:hypothetical protein